MIRKADIRDAKAIHVLVNAFASRGIMMPRSLNEIYENIRDFWVVQTEQRKVVACAALHVVGWNQLAEIKSLAVERRYQKKGLGASLVGECLREAKSLKIGAVFALSYQPKFFRRFGFRTIAKSRLPQKVWAECCYCPKFPDCGETALIRKI